MWQHESEPPSFLRLNKYSTVCITPYSADDTWVASVFLAIVWICFQIFPPFLKIPVLLRKFWF